MLLIELLNSRALIAYLALKASRCYRTECEKKSILCFNSLATKNSGWFLSVEHTLFFVYLSVNYLINTLIPHLIVFEANTFFL